MTAPRHTETALLLHLLRSQSDKTAFLELVNNGIDWDSLIDLSEDHRVVPVIFKRLKSEYAESVDDQVLEKFHSRYSEIAKLNFARSGQLIELFGRMQESGIPVIAYKGMALAKCSYNDVSLRQFGDIDLLIRKDDFLEAKTILLKAGCKPVWDLNSKQENAVLKHYYEYPFFYGEIHTLIEVHWEFLESFFAFDIDLEEVWGRAVSIDLYGTPIRTLSPADYVVVLSTHGSKHFWKRLSWIYDIAKLVENNEIDWVLTTRIADASGSLRMVRLALYLANDLFETDIPDELIEEIEKDPEVRFLGEKVKNFLTGAETEPAHWIDVARLHLTMRENISTKIKYSRRLFTTKLVDKLFMPMGRPR